MESFSVSTILDLGDWRALQRVARLRLWSPRNMGQRLLIRAPFFLIIVLLVSGLIWLRTDHEIRAFVIGILGVFLLGALQSMITQRWASPKPGGLFLGPTRYRFSAEGIEIERGDSLSRVGWSSVLSVEDTPTHVFVWLAQVQAYTVPARDLSGGLNAASVALRLRAFMAAARSAPVGSEAAAFVATQALAAVPAAQATTPRVGVRREIAAVAKQLLLLSADAASLVGSDRAIALLGGLALAIWLPLDWLIYTGPMEFMLDQLGGLALVILGALALAFLIARLSVPRVEYRRVLLVVTGSMFIAIAGSALFNTFSDGYWLSLLILLVLTAYGALYFKRALRTLTGFIQTRALLAAGFSIMLFVLMIDRLFINPSLWVYSGDDDAELAGGTNYQDAWRRIEDLQFDQRARIDAQVAAIGAHSAPGSQVYFVGFAGFGEQRVFAQEIGLAARRVAERYDAGEREIQLINDRRDLEKFPLATARALNHTLVSLGKVMDADDVLFLALSSHGDVDATLSVSNAGMMPTELDAGQIAEALRESGIRWKVIVISACHAGSFIDALADENTLILTAAAADRTSFGCADDRDLTYFGEAFYRDAMPKARSLRAAFEAAQASIAQREQAEGIEASEPEASYGVAVMNKLAEIEAR